MLDELLRRFREGDRRALSRLMTMVVRGERAREVLTAVASPSSQMRVVAVTGSGGVGKSTLIGKLLERIRRDEQTVAVLACDPQSSLTGGALLGDRFRMSGPSDDDGIFIRSFAAPGGKGAVTDNLDDVLQLLRAFGFDVALIETVGAGQGDTRARDLADVLVLLLQPETGDDLQWEKAGVLEVADLIVVHKSDLPGAENVEAQVLAMLSLSDHAVPPVLRVSARTGDGIDELWAKIREVESPPTARGEERSILQLAQSVLEKRFARLSRPEREKLEALRAQWRTGQLSDDATADALLRLLG